MESRSIRRSGQPISEVAATLIQSQEEWECTTFVKRTYTGVSVFLFHGKPGSGPGPHRHPYDEIQFIREGRGVWTVGGKTFEGRGGDIFVIKAGESHSFQPIGDSPLVQLDVHLSPHFIQENL
jgi:quercetin dioxygenase-like cupin family protein